MTNRWVILQVINIGTIMSTMDVGIVNVALPKMAWQFGIPFGDVQWVVTCYLLSMIALLPIFGRVSDMLSRRNIYSLGFLVFSLGCLFVALSWGFWSLILSRCIQGIGATMIMANSQAMVVEVFPNQERGRALGFNAVVISIGTLLGPALGGPLMTLVGWAPLFLVQVPLGVAGAILGMRWFPGTHQKVAQNVDAVGSGMLAFGLCLMLWAASNSEGRTTLFNTTIPALIGCACLVGLVLYESRIGYGILDRVLFTNRRIVVGNLSLAMINLTQTASVIALTFYMQDVLGYSPGRAGFVLCVQPLAMGLISPLAGWYRDRYGPLIPVTLGPLLCGVSTLCMVFSNPPRLAVILFQLTLFGFGIGLFQATNNADVMSASPPGKSSLAGSMLALLRYCGMSAGMGLAALTIGSIANGHVPLTSLDWGLKVLFMICSVLSLATVGLGWFRKPKFHVVHGMIQ